MPQSSRRKRQKSDPLKTIAIFLAVVLLVLVIFAVALTGLKPPPADTTGSTSSTQTTGSTGSTSTDGTTEPTGSTTEVTDPTTEPTDPTTEPTDPTTEPTDPTTQPTKPVDPAELEAFFSESVFIGDSVTLALRNYCVYNPNALYGAKILCAGSYAVRHAIVEPDPDNKNIVSISYQGTPMRPEDALAQIGAKRVFIMLGMNDIAINNDGINYTLGNWKILIDNIRAKCPDIEIYIQSATPLHASKDKDGYKLNNANMDIYNQRLEAFCQENGCYFVNLAPHFKDENGDLADEYCSDPCTDSNPNGQGCHFTTAGVQLWIQLLMDYATNR